MLSDTESCIVFQATLNHFLFLWTLILGFGNANPLLLCLSLLFLYLSSSLTDGIMREDEQLAGSCSSRDITRDGRDPQSEQRVETFGNTNFTPPQVSQWEGEKSACLATELYLTSAPLLVICSCF